MNRPPNQYFDNATTLNMICQVVDTIFKV